MLNFNNKMQYMAHMVKFIKMHGIGNDFVILDCRDGKKISHIAAKEIADSAIQVMGGYGYVGEYHVERLWRDSKLLEIGGGTVESHQKNITKDLSKNPNIINS